MGITHFVFIDNNSNDGGQAYLTKQSDCSIWFTKHSYKKSRFGMDWVNYLLAHYGLDKWCLVVDADEFLVYPFHDVRPIQALTNWLDASRKRTFGTTMLDNYAKGKIKHNIYSDGDDPLEKSNWFDAGNYIYSINQRYKNLWIQGGPRMRVFFKGNPKLAPALNKIPLVKWKKGYIYASSTHMLLPRKLNITYNKMGGEEISGALLHFKFSNVLLHKIKEEKSLKQHYLDGVEYKSYDKHDAADLNLWTPYSEKYTGWYQLEDLGLISKGGWA
jgi:hypothetical protein